MTVRSWKCSVAALVACLPAGIARAAAPKFGLPFDASWDGHQIDALINWTHLFNILLFVIMCGWMGWAVLRHNRKHTAEYDHGDSKRSIVITLGLASFIFFVLDGHLFVATVTGLERVFWNFEAAEKDPNVVRIEVNAHQWAWDGRYAGADGKFNTEDDVVTWNEFRVPRDAPVLVQLTSTDVVHAFNLPNFRMKVDAVPGHVNWLTFRPKVPGQYEIGCAQHCGPHHYKMQASLIVMEPDAYRKWAAEASENGKRAFDPQDASAHWGWEWKKR